ncbi:hypothetical protein BH10ACI1_BH10ACI1_25550 [soil metagenome]
MKTKIIEGFTPLNMVKNLFQILLIIAISNLFLACYDENENRTSDTSEVSKSNTGKTKIDNSLQSPIPTPTPYRSPTPIPTATPIPKPSNSDGFKLVESQIKKESGGRIKLVSFNKTNGVDRDMKGTKMYELDYTAEIEFLENCTWEFKSFSMFCALPVTELGWTRVSKGQRTKVNRILMFEMTEKGWRLVK